MFVDCRCQKMANFLSDLQMQLPWMSFRFVSIYRNNDISFQLQRILLSISFVYTISTYTAMMTPTDCFPLTVPHPKQHQAKFHDNKVHEANMGPIWGRQDPGGPHVGPINFAIWVTLAIPMPGPYSYRYMPIMPWRNWQDGIIHMVYD